MKGQRPPTDRAYLAAIVESSDDAILSKTTEGIIQTCNAAAERIFGYSADELIGQPVRILIPAERQAEEDEILRKIRSGERVSHFETVRVRKDGTLIDVSLSVSPLRNAAGEIVGASKIARDITARKKARETEAYLAAIVADSSDAILSKDLNGIIRSCNAAAERIYGYGAGELVGMPVRVLIPPERQAEEDEILLKIRSGERVDHFETARVTKDGRRIDVSLTISPVRDAAGRIVGASKIARDITEQKRVARELAAQQERFRVTLASIGDGVIAGDAQGRVDYLNETAEVLTGWPLAEAAGRNLGEVFKIVNEKTRAPVENPSEIVMRLGRVVGLANHTVLIGRDGVERPIADSAAPIRDETGALAGAVLVFRDVTQQRRAEDAIAEQREWFEVALESIGDAVIATDVQGRVSFMNPIAEHLTGWRLADARGRPCGEVFKIIDEVSRMTVESPITRVLAEGVIVGLANHTLLIAADGTERPIDDSGAPIRNRSGRVVGVVLVFRDVSERRRIENERRGVAAERERLLEAERVARAEAERASRVKDEFVAMASHELRTPLNAILGWTQVMTQPATDPDMLRRGLDVIARNTRVQAQLISDLLDMSRIVSGKLWLSVERLDLESIVENAIETVQQAAKDKRIAIRQRLELDTPIAGDPARVQQIVWNLLWNAIKFTPEGGSIFVQVQHRGSNAEITVADTGIGIKAEFLPHIFDRFQQRDANPSATRRFGGLGLGLAIAQHLVHLHGGSIRAESEGEGKGATFTVLLPSGSLATTAAVTSAPSEASELGSLPADLLTSVRILVVEDEADSREFLDQLLTAYGADVLVASTAAEALSIAANAHPNVLVSDIGLPEIDGYELLQRMRRMDPSGVGGIPAIAITAYARAEDRLLAFQSGYQLHLSKPVEPAQLVEAIARLVRSSAEQS
jgi:PAS domain S-box-containing protein